MNDPIWPWFLTKRATPVTGQTTSQLRSPSGGRIEQGRTQRQSGRWRSLAFGGRIPGRHCLVNCARRRPLLESQSRRSTAAQPAAILSVTPGLPYPVPVRRSFCSRRLGSPVDQPPGEGSRLGASELLYSPNKVSTHAVRRLERLKITAVCRLGAEDAAVRRKLQGRQLEYRHEQSGP